MQLEEFSLKYYITRQESFSSAKLNAPLAHFLLNYDRQVDIENSCA